MPMSYFIGLSVVMFAMGILGVLLRRNPLVVFMSLELMFNSANLLFVAFSAYHQVLDGQLFVFFVMTTAAAEVAVIVAVFKAKRTIDLDQMSSLKG